MPASKAQQRAVNKYMRENYDRFSGLTMPKGRKAVIQEAARRAGLSMNQFINEAIDEKIKKEGRE